MTKPPRFARSQQSSRQTSNTGFVLALIGFAASFAVIGWVMS